MSKPTSASAKAANKKPVNVCHRDSGCRKRHAAEIASPQSAARDCRQAAAGTRCGRGRWKSFLPAASSPSLATRQTGCARLLQSTGIGFILQSEQLGTGHAMMMARAALQGFDNVLVLSGDVPLIKAETIARVRDFHMANRAAMTMLTAEPDDPTGYGRVFRKIVRGKETDEVDRIVEQKALRGKEVRAARDQLRHLRFCHQASVCAHRQAGHRQCPPRVLPDRHRSAAAQSGRESTGSARRRFQRSARRQHPHGTGPTRCSAAR